MSFSLIHQADFLFTYFTNIPATNLEGAGFGGETKITKQNTHVFN